MTITHSNQFAEPSISELPSFVKDLRGAGSPFPCVHYWMPDRSGYAEIDERIGRAYFRQAVEYSRRPNEPTFLANVLVAMFQNLGPMESGFIDALLAAAQVGAIPPALTDQEVGAIADSEWGALQLRHLEAEMAEAAGAKKWLPDLLRLTVLTHLSGARGEHINGAAIMIARMALNGSRN